LVEEESMTFGVDDNISQQMSSILLYDKIHASRPLRSLGPTALEDKKDALMVPGLESQGI
jgi:hypothetical protein